MMNVDLTCPTCGGAKRVEYKRYCGISNYMCSDCQSCGRRLPTLEEWDAAQAHASEVVRKLNDLVLRTVKERERYREERDRLREALVVIADMVDGHHERAYQAAHDALDGDS